MKKVKEEKVVVCKMVSNDGEIINEVYEGDRLVRKSTIDYLHEHVEIGKDKGFTKMFDDILFDLYAENLTGKQLSFALLMCKYIKYDSGLIAYSNGKPIDYEGFMEITKMSQSAIFECLNVLVKKRIFAKTKVGYDIKYFANPYIFCKGTRINKTLEDTFKNSKWCALHNIE